LKRYGRSAIALGPETFSAAPRFFGKSMTTEKRIIAGRLGGIAPCGAIPLPRRSVYRDIRELQALAAKQTPQG
jgi:hypothetical protein